MWITISNKSNYRYNHAFYKNKIVHISKEVQYNFVSYKNTMKDEIHLP